jgi:hypothetical protein
MSNASLSDECKHSSGIDGNVLCVVDQSIGPDPILIAIG